MESAKKLLMKKWLLVIVAQQTKSFQIPNYAQLFMAISSKDVFTSRLQSEGLNWASLLCTFFFQFNLNKKLKLLSVFPVICLLWQPRQNHPEAEISCISPCTNREESTHLRPYSTIPMNLHIHFKILFQIYDAIVIVSVKQCWEILLWCVTLVVDEFCLRKTE